MLGTAWVVIVCLTVSYFIEVLRTPPWDGAE